RLVCARRFTLFPYTTLFRSMGRCEAALPPHPHRSFLAKPEPAHLRSRHGRGLGFAVQHERARLFALPELRDDGMAAAERLHNRRSEEHTSELQSPYDLVCRL